FWQLGYEGPREAWKHVVVNKVKEKVETDWRRAMERKNRLTTYRLLKGKLMREKYLDMTWGKVRKRVAEFRCGVNQLEMEVGRRKGVPRDRRYCKLCWGETEDEAHVLTKCWWYKEIVDRWRSECGVPEGADQATVMRMLLSCGGNERKGI